MRRKADGSPPILVTTASLHPQAAGTTPTAMGFVHARATLQPVRGRSVRLQHHSAFGDNRCGGTSLPGVLRNPLARNPCAFLGASPVLEHGDGESAASGPN